MAKENLSFTAYCGIYCGDCIHYQNEHSRVASDLKKELDKVNFVEYAKIDSPFGNSFKNYQEFMKVLNALIEHYCDSPCRIGNGCSSTPCEIVQCCKTNNIEGCWECSKLDTCQKFEFLEPRCGDMPKNNLNKIKKFGIESWLEHRQKFYIWLKD